MRQNQEYATMKEGGNIVQVEGGHILRSTGRKDRHSKVYTAKGPRDRRVRLSAHTAIQFYDVQDRLGYDRPSKAVDWLIKKAKTAIDKLNEATDSNPSSNELALEQQSSETLSNYALIQPDHHNNPSSSNLAFMAPHHGENEAHVLNTMKSFFPTTFPGFSNDSVISRASFQAEDLGLSLHSFQGDTNQGNSDNQMLPFQESFQSWNNSVDMDGSRVGFVMNNSVENSQQAMFSHREILQSNLAVNQWNQRPLDHEHNSQPRGSTSSDFGSAFELGFRVPARIYGEEEPENRC